MKNQAFRITYDGPALATSEMEVRELAPALYALGDLLEHANRVLNDRKTKIAVNVKGSFKTGSFGIDLALHQSLVEQVADLFSSKGGMFTLGMLTLLGVNAKDGFIGLIQLLKWIRGRSVQKVQIVDAGAIITVSGDTIKVELPVLALLQDVKVRESLEAVIYRPLQREGVDIFASGSDTEICETITKKESFWFVAPGNGGEDLGETAFEASVQIVRIDFNQENKWRFTDGTISFYATILDEVFLHKVSLNEISFASGDLLRVRVLQRQRVDEGRIKSEYFITEVLEHQTAYRQIRLPFDDAGDNVD